MTSLEEIKDLISVLKNSSDFAKSTMVLKPEKVENKLSWLGGIVERQVAALRRL